MSDNCLIIVLYLISRVGMLASLRIRCARLSRKLLPCCLTFPRLHVFASVANEAKRSEACETVYQHKILRWRICESRLCSSHSGPLFLSAPSFLKITGVLDPGVLLLAYFWYISDRPTLRSKFAFTNYGALGFLRCILPDQNRVSSSA